MINDKYYMKGKDTHKVIPVNEVSRKDNSFKDANSIQYIILHKQLLRRKAEKP